VNTSEHTKTTMDGGRNGGQNHSLAKRDFERPRSINSSDQTTKRLGRCASTIDEAADGSIC
jgi:hypothetical protein